MSLVTDAVLLAELEQLVRDLDARQSRTVHERWALATGALDITEALATEGDRTDDRLSFAELGQRESLAAGSDYFGYAATFAHHRYEVHFERGEYGAARSALLEVHDVLGESHSRRPEVLVGLSTLERLTGGDRTLEYLDAIDIDTVRTPSLVPQIYLQKGLYWIDLGLVDHALEPLARAHAEAEARYKGGDDLSWTRAALALIDTEVLLYGRQTSAALAKAEALIESPLMAMEKNAGLAQRSRLAAALALLLERRSDDDVDRAAQLFAGVARADASDAELRLIAWSRLAFLEWMRGRDDEALAALASAHTELEGFDVAGPGARLELAFLDAVRCRLAIDDAAARDELQAHRDDLIQALEMLVELWRAAPIIKGGRGLLAYFRPRFVLQTLCAVEFALDAEHGDERALEHVFFAQTASTLLHGLGHDGGTLEEFRRDGIPPDGGALVLVVGPLDSTVFAVDVTGCVSESTTSGQNLRKLATDWQQELETAPGGARGELRTRRLESLGAELRDALFPGAVGERVRTWTSVSFVGAEFIAGTPIAALPWGATSLGLALATHSPFSMPLANAFASRAKAATSGLVVIASPTHGADVDVLPLAMTDEELRDVVGRAPDARVFSGAEANVDAFDTLDARAASLLVVIAHGVRDAAQPVPAGVLLSPTPQHDGRVFSPVLRAISAPPIAFLGVCATARGPRRSGDAGAATLGGALLEAGAHCVVESTANVSYDATRKLAAAFVDEVLAGVAPAEALRRARVAVAAAGFDDPYFTCLLDVHGLGHVPVPKEIEPERVVHSGSILWGLIGVFSVLVFAAYVWRRR